MVEMYVITQIPLLLAIYAGLDALKIDTQLSLFAMTLTSLLAYFVSNSFKEKSKIVIQSMELVKLVVFVIFAFCITMFDDMGWPLGKHSAY